MDTSRHVGKTALVTGAGSGIGQATVVRLAAEGAEVVACDLNAAGLAETERLLQAQDLTAKLRQFDISTVEGAEGFLAAADGAIDILVNNAGIMDHFLPLGEMDDGTWDRVMAVNLTAVMRLTRGVLPNMLLAGRGAIVTVASEASVAGGVSGAAYATSKHAVLGLVRHVAYFYGPKGLRSNAVMPGGVATGIGATAAPQSQWAFERAGLALATMPPMAQPDEVAAVISWLASDEAKNVNGALLAADGGWSAA